MTAPGGMAGGGGAAPDRGELGGILVLAVGNVLAGDDGVGCHVVAAIGSDETTADAVTRPTEEAAPPSLPPGVRVVDGGTIGLGLLPLVEEADALVLIDAAELGAPPGAVRTLEGAALRGVMSGSLSVHQVGVADLLAAASLAGVLPDRVALVAVQPDSIGDTIELSVPVERAVPEAVEAVRAVVARFAEASAAAVR